MKESDQPHRLRLLGVFAHPDDETFCAGGTFAKYMAAGAEGMVVSATRGQAGQIRDARAATRQTLGEVREQELRLACAHLGVPHVEILDYVDGTLKDADRGALIADVVSIIRAFRPDIVITFGPDGAYGHPDHIAISEATTSAFLQVYTDEYGLDPLATGGIIDTPARLYHSHFPRSRMLMLDRLAKWLTDLEKPFTGTLDFVHALSLFAEEATSLGYASDHTSVHWFPPGCYVVEQGEVATSLYLIISGRADVVQEQADGTQRTLTGLGPGQFFGELGVARSARRAAHVIAVDNLTCLVFSPSEPAAFAGRGEMAQLTGTSVATTVSTVPAGATTCIDVSAYIDQKIGAVAAYRTQFPIEPLMFPRPMLEEMLGREYFLRVYPAVELETALHPRLEGSRGGPPGA